MPLSKMIWSLFSCSESRGDIASQVKNNGMQAESAKLIFEKATVHDGISINEVQELYNICPAKKKLEQG